MEVWGSGAWSGLGMTWKEGKLTEAEVIANNDDEIVLRTREALKGAKMKRVSRNGYFEYSVKMKKGEIIRIKGKE